MARLFIIRVAAQVLHHLALHAHQTRDRFKEMYRYANRTCLLSDIAADRLADPPGGVCAKLETARRVKFIDRPQQPQITLLDQIEERNTPAQITLGNADHQTQIGADQGLAGFFCQVIDDDNVLL